VWSKDGKNIAFASDRNGNLDVYLMPAQGGKAKRLTYHSHMMCHKTSVKIVIKFYSYQHAKILLHQLYFPQLA
jgi:tricorn protease-like protein